jgi:glutathione S-transferase
MKLYYSPGACSLAPHIAAKEEGLALDLERVDLATHKTEHGQDYRRLNPKGYVPALELDDGTLLTEIVAILPFIEQGPLYDGTIAAEHGAPASRMAAFLARTAQVLRPHLSSRQ